ncbi:MAG: hypothetical protein K2W96_14040, partial [Gemmataceae bacterium]|nr:hypothetical protein [Gemmataceae bacterium]
LALGGPANREAGFIYRMDRKSVHELLAFAGDAVAAHDTGSLAAPPEEEPESDAPLFLSEVLAEKGAIRIRFREGADIPDGLVLAMRDPLEQAGEWILLEGRPASLETVAPLPEGRVPDASVAVRWDGRSAWFPVRFDDKSELPPTPLGRLPNEGELIDWFLLGRFPGEAGEGFGLGGSAPAEVDEAVDTGGILSYQVRRFVQALPGIEAEVRRAAYSEASLHGALFGPASPVALAKRIAESMDAGGAPRKTPTAVGFQLVEIAAALDRCRAAVAEEMRGLCRRAAEECVSLLRQAEERHEELRNASFARYRDALLGGRP